MQSTISNHSNDAQLFHLVNQDNRSHKIDHRLIHEECKFVMIQQPSNCICPPYPVQGRTASWQWPLGHLNRYSMVPFGALRTPNGTIIKSGFFGGIATEKT